MSNLKCSPFQLFLAFFLIRTRHHPASVRYVLSATTVSLCGTAVHTHPLLPLVLSFTSRLSFSLDDISISRLYLATVDTDKNLDDVMRILVPWDVEAL